jgi:hypothetical protein
MAYRAGCVLAAMVCGGLVLGLGYVPAGTDTSR